MRLERMIKFMEQHSFYGVMGGNGKFIEQYLYGKCHIFAQALHLELGYNIKLLFDLEAEFVNEQNKETTYSKALVHAYCIKPDGTCIDISGKINCDTIEFEYGDCNSPQYELHFEEEDFLNSLNSINILTPTIDELNKVRNFIRRYTEFYN